MSRSFLAWMTDYSHQSFDDILTDLKNELKNLQIFIERLDKNLSESIATKYWITNVHPNFRNIIAYTRKHFQTTKQELTEIISELPFEVREHHVKRLQRISSVAHENYIDIGRIWHQDYEDRDYGNLDFGIVEDIYGDARDMAANLLDVSNMASRLEDFIGKTQIKMDKKQKIGEISNNTFGDNTIIVVGDQNKIEATIINPWDFESLQKLLERNEVERDDIDELKIILDEERPEPETGKLGPRVSKWIGKMVQKCLDGTWLIGIGAAGKLLADAIKAYYGLF